jgi:hypothetical protein
MALDPPFVGKVPLWNGQASIQSPQSSLTTEYLRRFAKAALSLLPDAGVFEPEAPRLTAKSFIICSYRKTGRGRAATDSLSLKAPVVLPVSCLATSFLLGFTIVVVQVRR